MRLLGVCMQPAEFEEVPGSAPLLHITQMGQPGWCKERGGGRRMSEGLHALHGVWGAREDSPHT